jgi:hypothetical protein
VEGANTPIPLARVMLVPNGRPNGHWAAAASHHGPGRPIRVRRGPARRVPP